MKVFNVIGNRYSGTIGKLLTAVENRGINYMRGYRVPKKPPTPPQTQHRAVFTDGSDEWNDMEQQQRTAYAFATLTIKKGITHYNGMMKSYMDQIGEGAAYERPAMGIIEVLETDTEDPLSGVHVYANIAGNVGFGRHLGTTTVFGIVAHEALVLEDQPYDFYFVDNIYKAHRSLYRKRCAACVVFQTHHLVVGSWKGVDMTYC